MNQFDPHFTMNVVVCICLIVAFISFRIGFKRAEWLKVRQQNRIWKAEQDRLPRAFRVKTSKAPWFKIFLRFRV